MAHARKILIVGGGLTGLSAGYRLAEAGMKVRVIEKERTPGGLARSFYYGGFIFDVGPHRFHTEDQEVLSFIKEMLGNEYVTMPRKSGVWLFNRYHDWPLGLSTLFKLPPGVIIRVFRDLFARGARPGVSFEDYILNKYGRTLYDYFFMVYTRKFLKHPPASIHSDWAKAGIDRAVIDRRLQMDTLLEVLKRTLLPTPVSTEFIYPKTGGVDTFARSLAAGIEEMGGEVRLGVKPTGFQIADDRIVSAALDDGSVLTPDIVIWTAPIDVLCELAGTGPTELKYLSAVLYNVEVEGISPVRYQWCYYGQDDIIFNRVSMPRYFRGDTCPPGTTGIGVEVTCMKGDDIWNEPEKWTPEIEEDMRGVGLVGKVNRIGGVHVERIENVYPIYDLDYLRELERTVGRLTHIANVVLAGRTGTFWYNNMDHSIRAGMECADDIITSGRGGIRPVYKRHDYFSPG